MLHCGEGVPGVMKGDGLATGITFSLKSKKLHFYLIWPEGLLPDVWEVSHSPFGEYVCNFSGLSFVKPSSVESTAGPMDRNTSLLCGAFQLRRGYLRWSLRCHSDERPPCLVWAFWLPVLLREVRCGAILFPFCDNGFNGAGVSDILKLNPDFCFPTTLSYLFGALLGLHGASWLAVLQTPGPFRTGEYLPRSCDS